MTARGRTGRSEVTERVTIDALDDIDKDTVAKARYEAEKILLRYVSPAVRVAYLCAIERAKKKVWLSEHESFALAQTQPNERCGG